MIVQSDGRPASLRRRRRRRRRCGLRTSSAARTTFRIRTQQILIYEAMGSATPQFAHLAMVLGPDHAPLSKRHGATSVAESRARRIAGGAGQLSGAARLVARRQRRVGAAGQIARPVRRDSRGARRAAVFDTGRLRVDQSALHEDGADFPHRARNAPLFRAGGVSHARDPVGNQLSRVAAADGHHIGGSARRFHPGWRSCSSGMPRGRLPSSAPSPPDPVSATLPRKSPAPALCTRCLPRGRQPRPRSNAAQGVCMPTQFTRR